MLGPGTGYEGVLWNVEGGDSSGVWLHEIS